jgi:hypothetical protein
MDERHMHIEMVGRRQRETFSIDQMLSQGYRMVGWREHELLVAEGHYRCPHCRRADTAEMTGTGISRR